MIKPVDLVEFFLLSHLSNTIRDCDLKINIILLSFDLLLFNGAQTCFNVMEQHAIVEGTRHRSQSRFSLLCTREENLRLNEPATCISYHSRSLFLMLV